MSKCGVVIPVGPGHQDTVLETVRSVEDAWRHSSGAFDDFEVFCVDDGEGQLGRSLARNQGVQQAVDGGCDWVFFLDADDVLCEQAFACVEPYLTDYDAVWGLILVQDVGQTVPQLRLPQTFSLTCFEEYLLFSPLQTLQIGHFVRSSVAQAFPFDVSLDVGEDVDYYLRIWETQKCVKIDQPLFVNCIGQRSVGPKSASGERWAEVVEARFKAVQAEKIDRALPEVIELQNRQALLVRDYYFRRGLAVDAETMAGQFPYIGELTVDGYLGKDFSMYFANDDRGALALFWQGKYEPYRCQVWQDYVAKVSGVAVLGSSNAFEALLAERVSEGQRVVLYEPSDVRLERCRRNVLLSQADVVCFFDFERFSESLVDISSLLVWCRDEEMLRLLMDMDWFVELRPCVMVGALGDGAREWCNFFYDHGYQLLRIDEELRRCVELSVEGFNDFEGRWLFVAAS